MKEFFREELSGESTSPDYEKIIPNKQKVNAKITILRVCDFLLFGNHSRVRLPFSEEKGS